MSSSLSADAEYSIQGLVRLADGSPAAGVRVAVVDRDLRSEQSLGETTAGGDGAYIIRYPAKAFAGREAGGPDLVVRALAGDGTLLTASPVLFNAAPSAVVDLTIPHDARRPPDRFDAIAARLRPLLKGLAPADLREDGELQDLTFLAGETGLAREELGRFALAHRLAQPSLPAPFWFLLLGGGRLNWPEAATLETVQAATTAGLAGFDRRAVRKALSQGLATGEADPALQPALDGWVEAFLAFAARMQLADGAKPTFLRSALDGAGVRTAARRETVVRRFLDAGRLDAQALQALEAERVLSTSQRRHLETALTLREVLDAEYDVVEAVKAGFAVRAPDAVARLARQPAEAWADLVATAATRGAIKTPGGADGPFGFPAARAYGLELAGRVRSAYPTQAFAGGLQRALEGGEVRGLTQAGALAKLLDRHPQFDLVHGDVDALLDAAEARADRALAGDPGFRREAKATQRVLRLAESFEGAAALLAQGLHSAQQVYRLGESAFVRRQAGAPGVSADEARRTWRRAAETHAAVLTVLGDLKALDDEGLPSVLKGPPGALAAFPNWRNLFRGGDLCDCADCRSVLGPAAYFADLLMYLRDRETTLPGQSALDLLLARRPDLAALELDCENALTPLPYVDVVCEVLEAAVAGPQVHALPGLAQIPADPAAAHADVAAALAGAGLDAGDFVVSAAGPDAWIVHGSRTSFRLRPSGPGFAAEVLPNSKAAPEILQAYPQFVNAAAYQMLRGATRPLRLPFDLFGEEVRALFAKGPGPRWGLMAALTGPAGPTETEIAAEAFEIAVDAAAPIDELRLIVEADPTDAGQRALWGGVADPAWLDTLAGVGVFLERSGLEYGELAALLDLPFIDPSRSLAIDHLDDSCDADARRIAGLNPERLDRMHRFLRLWRKLGWPIWELDLALRTPGIGGGRLDAAALVQLFHLSRLKTRLADVAVWELCGLIADLSLETIFTAALAPRAPGPYARIFRDPRLQPPDPALDPATLGASSSETLVGHAPAIQAALGIAQPDLQHLLARPELGADLDLANLTRLWRHVRIARALKLRRDDWLALADLLAPAGLALADARAAWTFVTDLDTLRAGVLKPRDLLWVLAADPGPDAATQATGVARTLTELREGLRAIRATYDPAAVEPPFDPPRLEAQLSEQLLALGRAPAEAALVLDILRDAAVFAAPVSLPPGFTLPAGMTPGRVRYDAAEATLRFTGRMTSDERTTLKTASSDPAYHGAVDDLFERPRLALRLAEPASDAPLDALPGAVAAGLAVAAGGKVTYDPDTRRLRLLGVLWPEDRARLEALSPDAPYQAAVGALFDAARAPSVPPDDLWLAETDLATPLRADDPAADNLGRNLAAALRPLLDRRARQAAEALVVRRASSVFRLPEALTAHLLRRGAAPTPLAILAGLADSEGPVQPENLPEAFAAWTWAARAAQLWRAWDVDLDAAEVLARIAGPAGLLDVADLPRGPGGAAPADPFLKTSRWIREAAAQPVSAELPLLHLVDRLAGPGYATAADFAADVIRTNPAWSLEGVVAMLAVTDLAHPAAFLDPKAWARLRQAMGYAAALNSGLDVLAALAAPTMGPDAVALARSLLSSTLEPSAWLARMRDVQDELRPRKRDALAAWLLAAPPPADAPTATWSAPADLYAYYLLDVEMGPCQLTSRLVQASGSVQLLVQRSFMGLEPQVRVDEAADSAWRWWRWMRKYRVWEANRKVFLWPENWIEPDLRGDRSPIFRELEQALLQGDLTPAAAEAAFATYVEGLDKVGQLEVAGFYQDDDGEESVLHVFGRSVGADPRTYHHRTFDYRGWTPWEAVDLDIEGDYLVPAVVNHRPYLFWPIFSELADEASNSQVPTPTANQSAFSVKRTVKRHEVRLAVSQFRNGAWTARKVSRDAYRSSWITVVDAAPRFYTFIALDRGRTDGRFLVPFAGYSLGSDGYEQAELFGTFDINGCRGGPELIPERPRLRPAVQPEWSSVGQYAGPAKAYTAYMAWEELGQPDEFGRRRARHDAPSDDFTLENTFATDAALRFMPVLQQTPWNFRMAPPWQLSYFDQLLLDGWTVLLSPLGPKEQAQAELPIGTWLPFFYSDRKRTFFVLPALTPASVEPRAAVAPLYHPQVKALIGRLEATYAEQVRAWVDAFDLLALTPDQRRALDQRLHEAFPEEAPAAHPQAEAYDEAETPAVRAFMRRFLMRLFNARLGGLALSLHHQRRLHFRTFYHPFVCDYVRTVQDPRGGAAALLRRETQLRDSGFSFRLQHQPTDLVLAGAAGELYPREDVDFDADGAYGGYNWELFFHVPLLIAESLRRNQRFEEARDWHHFIFNPLGVESAAPGGGAASRYWITRPFYETTDPQYVQQRIDTILRVLAGDTAAEGYSATLKAALDAQVVDWRRHPFEPHRIAAYRTVAYQKTVVMKYLDNLIAWGDHLFRQESLESLNEAAQLYVMAAELLGPKPRALPPRAKAAPQTFFELAGSLDNFGDPLVEVENLAPPQPGGGADDDAPPLPMLYFCIPQNDRLMGYWDTVADRLFKIRHCLNIEGVARQLPLFEPPLDPGLLVRAAAAGVDVGAALDALAAPLPLYRFQVLLQKANEVCADVRSLGAALLQALEKQDAEALTLLRQGDELEVLRAVRAVRERQVEEAQANLAAARQARELAEQRRTFYAGREFMNVGESLALSLSVDAAVLSAVMQVGYALSATTRTAVPQMMLGAAGFGGSPVAIYMHGGQTLADAADDSMAVVSAIVGGMERLAAITGTVAGYQRRKDDWDFQRDQAALEIEQASALVAAAEVRLATAERELEIHDRQIADAEETDTFLRTKFTGQDLYRWQSAQIAQAYFQSYQLAVDLARRAERGFRFELGLADSAYVRTGHWESLKQGLLAGERLQQDLRRLEAAYLEQNRREFELLKHVSLLQLDPLALVRLRETGACAFELPEALFDLDYPGHYFRRIKSVSLTLPTVTGPYTTVACTLRLVRSSVRTDAGVGSGYPRNTDASGLPADDPRFVEALLPVGAIATSGAQNDSGLFEFSFRDERYLPFEGAGVISRWSLELFTDAASSDFGAPLRAFDYAAISDAILHVKYTAREDAGPLKAAAVAHLRDLYAEAEASPSRLLLNLRRDFPSPWSRFLNPLDPSQGNIFEFDLGPQLFPYRDGGKTLRIQTATLLARCAKTGPYTATLSVAGAPAQLTRTAAYGGLHAAELDLAAAGVEAPTSGPAPHWTLRVDPPGGGPLEIDPDTGVPEVADIMIALRYAWA